MFGGGPQELMCKAYAFGTEFQSSLFNGNVKNSF